MRTPISPEKKAAWILFGIAATEGTWVAFNLLPRPRAFFQYLGFIPEVEGTATGWIGAAIVTAAFVGFALRLPSVRQNIFRPSGLKLLALAVAISAGILEEAFFRRELMNYLRYRQGMVFQLQILFSGLAFGLVHGVWGLIGKSIRAAIGATVVTGLLGAALGAVFVLSGRVLAPCIAAHFLINLLAEPGLVLAATRGEMGRRMAVPPHPPAFVH